MNDESLFIRRNSGQESTAAETAAHAQQDHGPNNIDGNEHGQGEEVWYRVAATKLSPIANTFLVMEVGVQAEDPDTAHNDPNEEERTQQTLAEVAAVFAVLSPVLIAVVISAVPGAALDNVYPCLD